MPYSTNLRSFEAAITDLQQSLNKTEEALLDLRDYEKRRAALQAEGDADLATKYGTDL